MSANSAYGQAPNLDGWRFNREPPPPGYLTWATPFFILGSSFGADQGIKSLREFSSDAAAGRAILPKHTIDTMEQLHQVVLSVADGRVIIDSSVMGTLLSPDQAKSQFLRSLSPKATEVLKLMSKGYRNEAIAEVLSRDLKTIERHINNIYSAFENGDLEGMHPRVRATLMYLKATGEVPAEPI